MPAALTVVSVTSEIYPLVKTGGLADVAGALPAALAPHRIKLHSLVPGYPAITAALRRSQTIATWDDLFGTPARLLSGKAGDLDLLVLDAPGFYDRPGGPYLDPAGIDWPDNPRRFAALSWVAARLGQGAIAACRPDLLHLHDWQAGFTPAYLHYAGEPHVPTVFTIHNIAFNGTCDRRLVPDLGLPDRAFAIDGVEFFGGISALKAALRFADHITTVSPTYAAEIQTPAFGMGFDGLLRDRAADLTGILNGIDPAAWDPADDDLITTRFDAGKIARRRDNKTALQAQLGLAADPAALLYGVVSRLSEQKGLDLVLQNLPALLDTGAQLALLGTGDPALEAGFRAAAAAHPGRIACLIGYDEATAHAIQAGADALLVPSRFEPCGLTQLCALRYGCIPVVTRVGGLNDTVIDANPMALAAGVATGIQFNDFGEALRRTRALFDDKPAWQRLQRNAMDCDVSWRQPARAYAALFRRLIAANR
jgi:starch synthase